MYSNVSPTVAAGVVSLGALRSPFWAVLAGFAVLAACHAVARIVPRRGTLRPHP